MSNIAAGAGASVLITGPARADKSVLLRAIAGIWPFGRGQIGLGEGRTLFVPQLPYLALGTLASAMLYPLGDESSFSKERFAAVLAEIGLGALAGELDSVEDWSQRLSQAENISCDPATSKHKKCLLSLALPENSCLY